MTVSATNPELGAALAARPRSRPSRRASLARWTPRGSSTARPASWGSCGMVPRLLVSTPSVAISWTTYEMASSARQDMMAAAAALAVESSRVGVESVESSLSQQPNHKHPGHETPISGQRQLQRLSQQIWNCTLHT